MGCQSSHRSRGLLLALAVTTTLSLCDLSLAASFFGDSYVELMLTEASGQTELSLRFRTHQRNALLFLAAGNSDYCLLELRAGRLQLRIELGSGEGLLRTEPGVRMNDLEWHRVRVQHKGEVVTMTVDNRTPSSVRLPGQLQELNIQHGLLLGGAGSLERPYLTSRGGVQSFRGCMEDAVFNGHDVLASLHSYAGHKTVHEVSVGCSPEFDANPDDPISFFSPWSYLAFPPVWGDSSRAVFEFQVRTGVKSGILLYHYRAGKEPPFAALEVRDGRLWSLLDVGERTVVLSPRTKVNDSRWHHIHFAYTAGHVAVRVDHDTVTESFGVGDNRKFVELRRSSEPLFVGGVDSSTRAEARRNGLASLRGASSRGTGGSLRGCLRGLRVDGERRSLQDALVSKDIAVGCRDSVTTAAPTAKLKVTVAPTVKPRRVKSTVKPTMPPTVPPTTAVATTVAPTSTTVKPTEPPLLLLHELVLLEGGKANINSKHIRMNINLQPLGNRPSQLFFRVLNGPLHGQIKVISSLPETESDSPNAAHKVFNLLDVSQDRVVYVHNGSEAPDDVFSFELYVTGKRNKLPDAISKALKQEYIFKISVLPVNDPPELVLPSGNLFTLVEQSRKKLTPDVLQAIDVDTNATELKISVLGNLNAGAGHLESTREAGKVITYFSYADMQAGDVYFVHHGLIRNSRIALRVSDGEKVSNTVVLRLLAVPGEFSVASNTGISVSALDGVGLILTANLSVRTNAADQDVEVQYSVTELPKRGEIQRLYESNGRWRRAESFTQRAMDRGHVSYVLSEDAEIAGAVTDRFRFKVSVFGKVLEEPQEFAIRINPAKFKTAHNRSLELDKVERAYLTQKNLQTRVEGARVNDTDIKYGIVTLPKKGDLYLGDVKLTDTTSFTQHDVKSKKVSYVLKERATSDMEDYVWFHIVAQRLKSKLHNFHFSIKADSEAIEVTNKGLSLTEGKGKLITKSELFLETLGTQKFRYQIEQSPRNGKLKKINLSDSADNNDNITTFTNEDIVNKRLMYVHDDSETTEDRFTFSAIPTDLNFSSAFASEFNITVRLENDEKPVRAVDRVLRVVRNGRKLLTTSDLAYRDADVDSDDAELVYTRRGIPNGELVAVDDHGKKLYRFRQGDLEKRQVLFVHHGADQGRFVFWVSDGKHQVTALLEVMATEAYARINNGTGLLVRKGHSQAITAANLSVDTNVDVRDDAGILFQVTESARHGQLLLDGLPTESFTQRDLRSGRVAYRHVGGRGGLRDRFKFTARLQGRGEGAGMQVDGSLSVRIFLESHQQPPTVVRNASLLVGEEEPVSIGSASLQVVHEVSPPAELVFTVREHPRHGFLRRLVAHGKEEEYEGSAARPLEVFTQLDVNSNRVQYVHNAPGQLSDSFSLDVGNGVSAPLSGLRVAVDVLPALIPLLRLPDGGALAVREGGSAAVLVYAGSPHFASRELAFHVSEPPKHGRVEGLHQPGIALTAFSSRQVERELVHYVHDDSETRNDSFTLLAVDEELRKRSEPLVVPVAVSAVNDEPPVVVANEVLKVWVDSVTEITSADLRAEDKDTAAEELAYSVSPPSNGLVALRERPSELVLNFTQADIDAGAVVFVHRGATSGGFNFQVTDGVNFAARQIFSITAKPLVLSMEVNNGLSVYPGSLHPITEQDLKVVTNDDKSTGNRSVVYSVIDRPQLGRIVRIGADNATVRRDSFTQAEVAEGLIAYDHQGGDMGEWSATDSFVFQASSPPAKLPVMTFHISVSYDNAAGRNGVLLANTGATVVEGDEVMINKSNLDASNLLAKLTKEQRGSHEIYLQVTVLPRHGFLCLGSFNVTEAKPYVSQANVNRHGLRYRHDGSERDADNFTFAAFPSRKGERAVRPGGGGGGDGGDGLFAVEGVFAIRVLPVNDQAPELKTKAPSLTVVQGFTAAITERHLKVVDSDSPAAEIKFTIISGPSNGRVALADDASVALSEFTQADVDAGRVVFVQDGSPASGVFYFSVTDGVHRPLFTLFGLAVEPLSVRLVNHSAVALAQGRAAVVVARGHLAGETNGRSAEVSYRVTRAPRAGLLLLDGSGADTFTQTEINAGSLAYHMTNWSASEDNFEFSAFTAESNVTGLLGRIVVTPLVKMPADLELPTGMAIPVSLDMLDARELANLTGHVPHYEVLRPPRHGQFVLRSLRGRRDSPHGVTRFTQRDIEVGLLFLEIGDVNVTGDSQVNDSFKFVLRAQGVQPAVGEFAYSIVPLDPAALPNITEALSKHDSSVTPPVTDATTIDSNVTGETVLSLNATTPPVSETPGKRPALRWRNKVLDRWGNSNKNGSADLDTLNASPSLSSDVKWEVAETVDKDSEGNLNIIIPVVVAVVALVIIVALALLVITRRKSRDVAKGFRSLKPNNVDLSRLATTGHVERSPTVPTVTVTALNGGGSLSAEADIVAAMMADARANPSPPPSPTALPYTWCQFNADMLQYCRTTSPSLRKNQYWV